MLPNSAVVFTGTRTFKSSLWGGAGKAVRCKVLRNSTGHCAAVFFKDSIKDRYDVASPGMPVNKALMPFTVIDLFSEQFRL